MSKGTSDQLAFARHSRESGNPVSLDFNGLKTLDDQPVGCSKPRFRGNDGSCSSLPKVLTRLRNAGMLWATALAVLCIFTLACSPRQANRNHLSEPHAGVKAATSTVANRETRYRLIESPLVNRDVTSSVEPLVLRGRGTSGRVLDGDGNVVIAASGRSIYGLQLSPSHDRALVHFGDADYQVIDTRSYAVLAVPPPRPEAVEHATGFGWHFVDDKHLVGDAELPSRADTTRMTVAEVEALPPYATLLYVYELESETLVQVDIDNGLPPMFSVHEVSGWDLTLLTHDSELVGARIVSVPTDGSVAAP